MNSDVKDIKLTEQQKRAMKTFIPSSSIEGDWDSGGITTDAKVCEVVTFPWQPMANLEKKGLIFPVCYDNGTGHEYELTELGIEYMRAHHP